MSDYFLTSDGKLYTVDTKSDELMHYGVKGMKWGVRRYQNADGSLTNAGKRRFTKIDNSKFKTNIQNRQAKRIYRSKAKDAALNSIVYKRAADVAYKKADKNVWKSEKAQNQGNQKKFEKYQGKAWKQLAKQYESLEKAKKYTNEMNMYNKKISDIDSGTLKAGRDFIVKGTTLLLPGIYYSNETIIEKKK